MRDSTKIHLSYQKDTLKFVFDSVKESVRYLFKLKKSSFLAGFPKRHIKL